MNPESPEFPSPPIEKILESDYQRLKNTQRQLANIALWVRGDAKIIYGGLLDIQTGKNTSEQSIRIKENLLKSLLNTNISDFDLEFDTEGLKEKLQNYFLSNQIDFQHLVEDLQHQVMRICNNKLPTDITKNPFRISLWMEKISIVERFLEKFVQNCEIIPN